MVSFAVFVGLCLLGLVIAVAYHRAEQRRSYFRPAGTPAETSVPDATPGPAPQAAAGHQPNQFRASRPRAGRICFVTGRLREQCRCADCRSRLNGR